MLVRRKVWLIRKHVAEVGCHRIEEVVWSKAKDPVDGLVDAHDAGVVMADVTWLDPWAKAKHKRALAIDVVTISTRVILCYEHDHLLPLRLLGEELQNAAKGEVIVRHIAGCIWITTTRIGSRTVVVTDCDVQEAWQSTLVGFAVLRNIIHEPVCTGDVWDVVVVCREFKTGVVEKNLRHRDVDKHVGTRLGVRSTFIVMWKLIAFAVVTERNVSTPEVLPERAIFEVILWNLRAIGAKGCHPSACRFTE